MKLKARKNTRKVELFFDDFNFDKLTYCREALRRMAGEEWMPASIVVRFALSLLVSELERISNQDFPTFLDDARRITAILERLAGNRSGSLVVDLKALGKTLPLFMDLWRSQAQPRKADKRAEETVKDV